MPAPLTPTPTPTPTRSQSLVETERLEVVVVEPEVVCGLVEHGDADLLRELLLVDAAALEVLAVQQDVGDRGRRVAVLGERDALEDAQDAGIEAVADDVLGRQVVDQDRHLLEVRADVRRQLGERGQRDPLDLVLRDGERARRGSQVEEADRLPRNNHGRSVVSYFVDPSEQMQRVGLHAGLGGRDLAGGFDPADRTGGVLGGQRELREVERELGIVDHAGRQLAERFAGRDRLAACDQGLGLDVDRLDQVGLFVDEGERGVDGIERGIGIGEIVELESRDADAGHRIVGSERGQRAILCKRGLAVAARIGDRGRQRDHVGVRAIDPFAALEEGRRGVELAGFERFEAAFEICEQSIRAGHQRYLAQIGMGGQRFAARSRARYCRAVKSVFLVLLVAVAFACGGRAKRRTLVPDVPHTGDAKALARFTDAKAKFLKDGKNREEFNRIAEDYPDDVIVPWAKLYAGIAAVGDRKYDVAVKSFDEVLSHDVPDGLAKRAHLFLGIAKNYLGDAKSALGHLKKGADAVENNEAEKLEYLAALAYATSTVEPLASLPLFEKLYARVTPTERTLIVARCDEVAAGADPGALKKALDDLDKKGPAMAAVASRLAMLADQSGNAGEAQRFRELAAPARHAVGLPKTIRASSTTVSGSGNPGLLGAVMPGGKNKAGDAAQAGLGLAAGASGGGGVAAIEIRSAADASAAALAVEHLAKQNVVAIIGPIDGASVDAAGGRAEGLGVPLLSLAARPEERTTGRFVFHLRHSAEARGRALARKALSAGIKTFAIMSPDDSYGKSVTAAFTDEVSKGGGSIVSKVIYPDATKSFVSFAGKLSGSFEALFVPDTDVKLALIAPAVSAAGRIPKPIGSKTRSGKQIVLLSTAEGLTGTFLGNADRHADGAILAPGYYPDDKDPAQKTFLDRFLAAFGRAPGPNEAYAYDGAMLAAAAGTGGRAALAATLAAGKAEGITGAIRFDKDHLRADPGVLYMVVEESGVYAIRRIP
jgi:ABC-type branched-subunit amino acid transport system substrate-binding protein/tetratricopeptide (TPR) repeat protein